MVIATIVHMRTCNSGDIYTNCTSPMKKKEDIFTVVTKFLQEFFLSLFSLVF